MTKKFPIVIKVNELAGKLELEGHQSIAGKVRHLQTTSGTSGEVLDRICFLLLDLKKTEPEIYSSIKKEGKGFLDFARSLGREFI